MTRALAIVSAPRCAGAAAAEFLRVLLALRAVAAEVTLAGVGPGADALATAASGEDDEVRALLDALAKEGVVPAARTDVAAEASRADAVLVLSDPARAGAPPVLRWGRGARVPAPALAALPGAGQVVLG